MSELIRNPKAMKRAQEEIRGVVKGKEMVEEIDLSRLLYLKSFVKEDLRLHPPVPLLMPTSAMDHAHHHKGFSKT